LFISPLSYAPPHPLSQPSPQQTHHDRNYEQASSFVATTNTITRLIRVATMCVFANFKEKHFHLSNKKKKFGRTNLCRANGEKLSYYSVLAENRNDVDALAHAQTSTYT